MFRPKNNFLIKKFPQVVIGVILAVLVLLVAEFAVFKNGSSENFTDLTKVSISPFDRQKPIIEKDTVYIPSLDIKAPLVYVGKTSEAAFQEALKSGVVHYPGTALVGDPGNSYFFGHSSDFLWSKGDYKKVFEKLPNIKKGEVIYISDQKGVVFKYVVVETKIVEPDDVSVLSQGAYQKRLLTLQTSYPVGTAKQRFVALAEAAE